MGKTDNHPETLLWTQGWSDWRPAKELFEQARPATPTQTSSQQRTAAQPLHDMSVQPSKINGERKDLLKNYSFKEIRTLYYSSRNIIAILLLLVLWIFIFSIMLFAYEDITPDFRLFLMITIPFYLISAIGMTKRTKWGRILGIIISFLMLGIAIGIIGLISFIGSPELFGRDRFTHKRLKSEFKYRKKTKLLN